jgi:hypothetical protein
MPRDSYQCIPYQAIPFLHFASQNNTYHFCMTSYTFERAIL